jgi:Tfp pilus assembly protein PilX
VGGRSSAPADGCPLTRFAGRGPSWAGHQRGFVLLTVVMALVLVATVALLINRQGALGASMTAGIAEGDEARYVAEAGLQHAIWHVQNSNCGGFTNIPPTPFGLHTYSATVTPQTMGGAVTTYNVLTDQDTWVQESSPMVPHGGDLELQVKNASGDNARALYRFDLSGIPVGAHVLSATAWFYVTTNDDQGPVNVHRVNTDWAEGTATWDTVGGSYDPTVLAAIPSQSTNPAWVAVPLTGLTQAWVSGASPNYGVTLVATSSGLISKYTSKEWTSSSQRPWLQVVISDQAGPIRVTINATGTLADGISRTVVREDVGALQPASTAILEASADTYLRLSNVDDNYGVDTFLATDSETGGGKPMRTLIRFDLSAIPSGAVVESATLELYLFSSSGSQTDVVEAFPLTQEWVEGTGGTNAGASWDLYDGVTPWVTPGGDRLPDAVAAFTAGAVGWKTMDLATVAQAWLDGTLPNYGLVLASPTSGGNDEKHYYSREYADPSLRPRLTVVYTCECGQDCTGGGAPLHYYRDELSVQSCDPAIDYVGSDGTLDWTPWAWQEIGDDDDPCTGNVQVAEDGGLPEPGNFRTWLADPGGGVTRRLDISSLSTAYLNFDYRREALGNPPDGLTVEVSPDGGATWVTMGTIWGPGTDAAYRSACYDISTYRAADTRVRFVAHDMVGLDGIYLDNVQVDDFMGCQNTALSATADSFVEEDDPDAPKGTDTRLELSEEAGARKRILLHFDTTTYAPGTALQNAVLRIYVETNSLVADARISAWRLTEGWVETEVSWNERTAGVPWATPGGSYSAPAATSNVLGVGVATTWYELDITPLVQQWVDSPAENFGVLLSIDQPSDVQLRSLDDSGGSYTPALVVTVE